MLELEDPEAEHVAIDPLHAIDSPVLAVLLDDGVEGGALGVNSIDELDGERVRGVVAGALIIGGRPRRFDRVTGVALSF